MVTWLRLPGASSVKRLIASPYQQNLIEVRVMKTLQREYFRNGSQLAGDSQQCKSPPVAAAEITRFTYAMIGNLKICDYTMFKDDVMIDRLYRVQK